MKVEGMGLLYEDCPIFDMYLPEQKVLAKPAPFWNVKPTHEEAEANMELISVAVSVGVSAAMTGNLKSNSVGTLLKSYINPETTVTVTLPLFVNHKHLYVGDQLRFYKPAEEPAEKKRGDLNKQGNTTKRRGAPAGLVITPLCRGFRRGREPRLGHCVVRRGASAGLVITPLCRGFRLGR